MPLKVIKPTFFKEPNWTWIYGQIWVVFVFGHYLNGRAIRSRVECTAQAYYLFIRRIVIVVLCGVSNALNWREFSSPYPRDAL
jgi:hypothetical protein